MASALCMTALIQNARHNLSDYHRIVAHHSAFIMIPAICSMVVKCIHIRKCPQNLTIASSILCICFNFALAGTVISHLSDYCIFNGVVASDPISSFPTILIGGAVAYFVTLPLFALVQYFPRFKNLRKYLPVVCVFCQVAAIFGSVGFIIFIELLVREVQPYLQGGSENTWGFGQVLSLVLLVLPTVDIIQQCLEKSKDNPPYTKLENWKITQIDPLWMKIRNGSRRPDIVLTIVFGRTQTKSPDDLNELDSLEPLFWI